MMHGQKNSKLSIGSRFFSTRCGLTELGPLRKSDMYTWRKMVLRSWRH